jgi:hypothetical protein
LNPSDVPPNEMSGQDERFEDALRGGSPLSPEDDLGAFVRDVREAFPAHPILAQEAHIEAVAETARTISERGRTPIRKESHMRIPRLRSKAALIVAGLVVAMLSFGGLAAADVLPDGVQDGVANVASLVGVHLPGGSDETEDDATEVEDDADEAEEPELEETDKPEPSETESPEAEDREDDTNADDKGDDQESDSNDQGEDEQSGGGSGQDDSGEESEDEGEDGGED